MKLDILLYVYGVFDDLLYTLKLFDLIFINAEINKKIFYPFDT